MMMVISLLVAEGFNAKSFVKFKASLLNELICLFIVTLVFNQNNFTPTYVKFY